MKIYATPAAPVNSFPYTSSTNNRWLEHQIQLGGPLNQSWQPASLEKITWNSVGESLLDKMQPDRLNIPKVGAYYKFPPLSSFYFYTVGGSVPSVFRIGKKYSTARLNVIALESEEKKGMFQPTCPVNVSDLPKETKIRKGSILTIPPTPLLIASELEGSYLECRDPTGIIHLIPRPKKGRFIGSWGD